MAEATAIEWADDTFNGWWGCTEISDACTHCYARELARRFGKDLWGDKPRELKSDDNWRQPLKWNAAAAAFEARHGRKRFVFCNSMSDVFDNQVPEDWRTRLWDLIRQCDQLVWLLLTKRPQNIAKMLPDDWGTGWKHVWLGATVEHQEAADRNIPSLLTVPAARRFLSCEPLLGPIDLGFDKGWCRVCERETTSSILGHCMDPSSPCFEGEVFKDSMLHWVIAGGESGPNARPSHPDWFRSLRDQCAAADVPFLFKQWGEWGPTYDRDRDDPDWRQANAVAQEDGRWMNLEGGHGFHGERVMRIRRIGKKRAGRTLDGVTHDGRPEG